MAEGTALRGDEAPVTKLCKPRPRGPLWGGFLPPGPQRGPLCCQPGQ